MSLTAMEMLTQRSGISTGFDARITEVTPTPAPASLALFGIAAASLGACSSARERSPGAGGRQAHALGRIGPDPSAAALLLT